MRDKLRLPTEEEAFYYTLGFLTGFITYIIFFY